MYSFVFLKIIKVFGKEKTKKKKRENVKLVTNRIIGNINNNININNNKIACILKIKLLNFKNMKS